MKIVLTNSNIVLNKAKDWVEKSLSYRKGSVSTGIINDTTYDDQYAKSATQLLSVSTDGIKLLPVWTANEERDTTVFLYNSQNTYIGYALAQGVGGQGHKMSGGVEVDSLFTLLSGFFFNPDGTAMADDTAKTNTASYIIAVTKFTSNDGVGIKVK